MRGERVGPVGGVGLLQHRRRPEPADAVAVQQVHRRSGPHRPEHIGVREVADHQPQAVQPVDQPQQLQHQGRPLLRVRADDAPGGGLLRVEQVLRLGEPGASGGRPPGHRGRCLAHQEADAARAVHHPAERPGGPGVQPVAVVRRQGEPQRDQLGQGRAVHPSGLQVALEQHARDAVQPAHQALAAAAGLGTGRQQGEAEVRTAGQRAGEVRGGHAGASQRQTTERSSS